MSTVGQLDPETFKFIFREAKIQDAVVFFDECESLFETRSHGVSQVASLLTEIERFEGVLILATNRPHDMDEAMHRRIALTIEFPRPVRLRVGVAVGFRRAAMCVCVCVCVCSPAVLGLSAHRSSTHCWLFWLVDWLTVSITIVTGSASP